MTKAVAFAAKWLWSSYETWGVFWAVAAVVANGGASGGGAAALLNEFTEWPLWLQIAISVGVALVWLSAFNWIVAMFKQEQLEPAPGNSVHPTDHSAAAQGGAVAAAGRGIAAGRDVTILTDTLRESEKHPLRNVVQRAVDEAKFNIDRRGRQRRLNVRRRFADMLHHHHEYLTLNNWPDLVDAFEDYYDNLTMQVVDAPRFDAYQHDEHYQPKIVEPGKRFIAASKNYLDRPPIRIIE